MMNYIWVIITVFSFFCAIATDNMNTLSSAVISGGTEAITLVIKLSGIICFWNGLMAIAEKSGLTKIICNLLKPALKLLFPKLKDEKAKNAISMNITANLLGLGNAATPLGLEAMKRLQESSLKKDTATDEMVRFVVLNSAALHLVPTTVALLRHEFGSQNPMEILLPSVFTSLLSVSVGVLMTFILRKAFKI
ncbi:MAG: spore maturation protein [Ruminococcaceae bacterium]|nr:spore maturation protein [Oscillospiraceae bacterium]